jgi:hypothetical protein
MYSLKRIKLTTPCTRAQGRVFCHSQSFPTCWAKAVKAHKHCPEIPFWTHSHGQLSGDTAMNPSPSSSQVPQDSFHFFSKKMQSTMPCFPLLPAPRVWGIPNHAMLYPACHLTNNAMPNIRPSLCPTQCLDTPMSLPGGHKASACTSVSNAAVAAPHLVVAPGETLGHIEL